MAVKIRITISFQGDPFTATIFIYLIANHSDSSIRDDWQFTSRYLVAKQEKLGEEIIVNLAYEVLFHTQGF
jgi:hypothetical protein